MARKIETVQVPPDFGRDAGKRFLITEWPATKADDWATRTMLAYNRGGGDLSADELVGRGMEAIFFIGVQTFLRGHVVADEIIPLLNQLLNCVQFIRDPNAVDKSTGSVIATPIVSEDDIEEIRTLWWLRSEVLRIHMGFSPLEIVQRWISRIMVPQD